MRTCSTTTGITGSADSTFVLTKQGRSSEYATLSLTGRDIEFQELKLRRNDCQWELIEKTSLEELEAFYKMSGLPLRKLFNTSGWNVTYNGQQTQWLYIDDPESLERGDLIFFSKTKGGTPTHAAIYTGLGGIIHADPAKGKVKTSTIRNLEDKNGYYVVGVRRIFN